MKNNTYKSGYSVFMTIYQNHIYFTQLDSEKTNYAIIKFKYPIRHIETKIDRTDLKILHLIVKDSKDYEEVILYFTDASISDSVHKIIEESRYAYKSTEYILLESYVEDLINNTFY
jgi:hypothetical protein